MWPARPDLMSALADQYTLYSVLGVGGTSTVYRATDRKHNRDVAVKVLHLELAATLTRQRFARETAIAAKLQHPHILPLIDSGAVAGTYYYVMPLVGGVTLRERLAQEPTLSTGEVTRILSDLADALVCAHDQGVVHRDIKPSNVLLTGRHALLMDFGVAKGHATPGEKEAPLTTGVALGTPTYMAPEQAMAQPDVDHRADLYALGVLGYELLAGHPPFSDAFPRAVLAAHVSQTPEPLDSVAPGVPVALSQVVMRCLEKEPSDRWADASEVVKELDAIDSTTDSSAQLPSRPYQTQALIWRRLWVTIPAAIIIVTAGALALPRPQPAVGPSLRHEQITHVGNAIESAISSDGQWLAYVTSEGVDQTLYVRDLKAPTALQLDRDNHIAGVMWSSDGSEIAYHKGSNAGATVRAIPRLGGPSRTIGVGHGYASPDLTRIALLNAGALVIGIAEVARADTAFLQKPTWVRFTGRLAWSADSKSLAVAASNAETSDHAILVASGEGPFVEAVRDSVLLLSPSFSRDRRFIYFSRQTTGQLPDLMRLAIEEDGRPQGTPQIVSQAFDGDFRTSYFDGIGASYGLGHTVDGDIVYTRMAVQSNVARFEADAPAPNLSPTFLSTGSAMYSRVRLAPDRRRVAFLRLTRTETTVGVMPITGGPSQSIVTSFQPYGDVAWSPAGDRIAMTWTEQGFGMRLGVYDFATGALEEPTAVEIGANLTWAEGNLVVQGPGNRALLMVEAASGGARGLVPDSVGYHFAPRVSPDGRRLAYFKRRGVGSGVWLQELSAAAGPRLVLDEDVFPLGFDETGEILFVSERAISIADGRDDRRLRVRSVSLRTGEQRTVLTLPEGFVPEDISPDGKTVLATQVEWRGDVWRLSPPIPPTR